MSSAQPPQPSQRYPKRKRRQVSYKIGDESEELGEDLDFALSIQDDPDNEVDWKTAAKKASETKARKKQNRKAAKKNVFPFMKLPPELRNHIYKYCLQTPGGVVKLIPQSIVAHRPRKRLVQSNDMYVAYNRAGLPVVQHSTRNLALLRVSKGVFQEAVGFVYGQEFHFKQLHALWNFLSSLSPKTKSLLRHLEVKPSESEWNFLPAVAQELPMDLNRLIIHNLGGHVGVGNPSKYLKATRRAVETLDINLPALDSVLGIVLAKATYDFLHPFIVKFGRKAGVDKAVDVLDLFKTKPKLDYRFYSVESRFRSINHATTWSAARGSRARDAMIQEITDLMEKDNVEWE